MCRRAIEPRHGYWTCPAASWRTGKARPGGHPRKHAKKPEQVAVDAPFSPDQHSPYQSVHLFYRGRLLAPDFRPAKKALRSFCPAIRDSVERVFRSVAPALNAIWTTAQSAFRVPRGRSWPLCRRHGRSAVLRRRTTSEADGPRHHRQATSAKAAATLHPMRGHPVREIRSTSPATVTAAQHLTGPETSA